MSKVYVTKNMVESFKVNDYFELLDQVIAYERQLENLYSDYFSISQMFLIKRIKLRKLESIYKGEYTLIDDNGEIYE